MRALHDLPAPHEDEARDRALELALAAHAARPAAPSRSRRRRNLALAGVAAAGALLVLTPTGSAVTEWFGDTVRKVVNDDPPARASGLDELPGGGRVLVVADRQAWIAGDGEPRRLLSGVQDATWSPHGRFVAAARGAEVLAVDPKGDIRWALRAPARVHALAWSPSGFRVAYAAGAQLRLVAGDGTGDRLVASRRHDPAFTSIAWRPGRQHVLAFADRNTVFVADTDLRRVLWQKPVPRNADLAFSPDGRRLLVASPRELRVLDARAGRLARRERAPAGTRFGEATWNGRDLAVVRRSGPRSEIVVGGERLFAAGDMSVSASSPDGRWLLVDWTETGTWLFLPLDGGRARQVTGVPGRFDARAANPAGWCCGP